MKLVSYYTDSHEEMKDNWFLPSLKDPFELVTKRASQVGQQEGHRYGAPEFRETVRRKIEFYIEIIEQSPGETLVLSDVDIQFLRPCQDRLVHELGEKDISFQRNDPYGQLCTGFMICRSNARTAGFFRSIVHLMKQFPKYDDQDIANFILMPWWPRSKLRHHIRCALVTEFLSYRLREYRRAQWQSLGLRWDYLPDTFFCGGTLSGKRWEPGQALHLPGGILLHHANWTVGIANKVAQMELVRQLLAGNPSSQ